MISKALAWKKWIFPTILAVLLLLFSKEAKAGAAEGIQMCLLTVIPALMPFCILTNLLMDAGAADLLGRWSASAMEKHYNLQAAGSSALIMGFLGGYPLGAKTAALLREKGIISRRNGMRLAQFCNNSGPAFFLGMLGTTVFGSLPLALLSYVIHIGSGLLTGKLMMWISGKSWVDSKRIPLDVPVSHSSGFTAAVTDAVQSMLKVSGFVIFFCVLIRLAERLGLIVFLCKRLAWIPGLSAEGCKALIYGIVELSTGCCALSNVASLWERFVLSGILMGWGGLCVSIQAMSFLLPAGLMNGGYWLGKLMQAVLSGLIGIGFAYFVGLWHLQPWFPWKSPGVWFAVGITLLLRFLLKGKKSRKKHVSAV